jgi:hypothetical protein
MVDSLNLCDTIPAIHVLGCSGLTIFGVLMVSWSWTAIPCLGPFSLEAPSPPQDYSGDGTYMSRHNARPLYFMYFTGCAIRGG